MVINLVTLKKNADKLLIFLKKLDKKFTVKNFHDILKKL